LLDRVDVLLVNYLTPELTAAAVRSLAGASVSFWVRDNSSDLDVRGVRDAAQGSALVVRADGRNSFYAEGNNELYSLGDAPYVLLLNPDVQLTREALDHLLSGLRSGHSVWAAAPRLLNPDGSPQDYYRRLPSLGSILCDRLPLLRRLMRRTWARHIYHDEAMDVRRTLEAPPAACLLFKRELVGTFLFDEAYSLFYNDTDLCRRMIGLGYSAVLIPCATATHLRGASLAKARSLDRFRVARLYDRNCLSYSKSNIRHWWLVSGALLLRRMAETLMTLRRDQLSRRR
jgi:N-acetylglucosaminyl-diphospho-decaprenol L-rhamnosyltransferase